jgi:16S rRNA (guanine527-N7)-methyltransferase
MTARSQRRLAALAGRFDLPASIAPSLDALLHLLETDPAAPTKITNPATAIDAHVADALVALELDEVRVARRVADLGSGAGFPGLVLAAALPAARVALVEASAKKCDFLARAADAMGLVNVEVVGVRAERWDAGMGACDLVTARAVAPLNVLVEYAAPLLAAGGSLRPWAGAEHLHLHLYLKVGLTPNRYPRRPGMASKRPLRAST